MKHLTRLAVAAGLVAVGGLTLPGGAAEAAACPGTTGVTVVVRHGSSTTIGCAPGDPTSGLDALRRAGFGYEFAARQPGFVCRINGFPTKAADACQQASPASAYWAYYHARRGGSWSYSQEGAGEYDPAPGSVEGWAFGAGATPGAVPAAPVPPRPSASQTPRPTPKPSTTPRPPASTPHRPGAPSPTSGPSAPGSPTGGSPTTSGTRPTTPTTGTPGLPGSTTTGTAGPTPSGTASPGEGPTGAPTGDAGTAAGPASDGSSGSIASVMAGLALVALVGAGAAYLAIRRRLQA